MYRQLILAAALSLPLPTIADVLFETKETVRFVLEGNFRLMQRERDKTVAYPGKVVHNGTTYDVDISLRGNRRLSKEVCDYPPLRLDFSKKQIKDTIFDKQDDVKLVVQCDDPGRYADYLRTEYLAYAAISLVTLNNYRARWAEITYRDTDDPDEVRVEPAFFVERKSRLAKRAGLDKTNVIRVAYSELEARQATLMALMQFVIGNPDFSLTAAPPGEECCHNAKLLVDDKGRYHPVIYDFDSTGLVDASYAVPPDGLGIRRVTQRVFRGYCAHNDKLKDVRDEILGRADAILALFEEDPVLSDRAKRKAVRFLTQSFETLRDEDEFRDEIIEECRG